jgi:DNA-binding GntR family transcriptional regulator
MASKVDAASRRRTAKSRLRPRAAGSGKDAPPPLYQQVVQALKDEILKGVYPVGGQLPTEEELCARFQVSRYTVREALRRLRDDRLVSSRQGAGTTVIRPGETDSYVHEVGSVNDLIAFAVGARYQIDESRMVTADGALAARLDCQPGDEWLSVRGFRYAADSDLPVCWAEVFINAEFAGVGRLLQRHRGPIFELIEDLYGEHVGEVHQELSARPVPDTLADGLGVDGGDTAIEVQRTYRLASGKTAQVVFNLHPAERFRYAMTMRRVKS